MRILLAVIAVCAGLPAHAQDIPRTPDGRPDFQGIWISGFLTQLERPDGIGDLVIPRDQEAKTIADLLEYVSEGEVYDPEADYGALPATLLEMDGDFRSSQIFQPADGKLPLTSLARAVMNGFSRGYDNPEVRPGTERCVDGLVNPPIGSSFLLIPVQFVQTPDSLVMATEDADAARIVGLSGNAWPAPIRTRNGQSRGVWEGDTLVITTDRLAIPGPSGFAFRGGGTMITADSRVIERVSLISPDLMLYQFTIEDTSLYSQPWLAEYVMKRVAHDLMEYACHEANHSLVHILTAARLGLQ
ncbi:MAG: hypothetical protein B7Y90_11715 [Alphaproteobacteria bacterium 32-64-14]|nr:MAG: hypothetical protein B7Y90_11715 [Alphaproteobacteria bacterium 32-64-14]